MQRGRQREWRAPAIVLLLSAVPTFSVAVGCGTPPGVRSSQNASGLDADVPVPPEVPAVVRTEILELSDEVTRIYKRGDWPALASLVAPDYLGCAPGVEWDLAKLKVEFPKIRLIDYRAEGATVKALAPGLILLNQDGLLKEAYDGQDVSGRYRFTTIWARREGRWRLLFEQEIPLSSATEVSKS